MKWLVPKTSDHTLGNKPIVGCRGLQALPGISLEASTELHTITRGSPTRGRYLRDVLEEYVMPFAPSIGENLTPR